MFARLVTVSAFEDPLEAARARDLLESHGMHATLVGPDPIWGWVFSGTTLRVPEGESRRANEILDPLCRSRPDTPAARRAMYAALLGFTFPPFSLYSLWLLARLLPHGRDLSACDRRRMRFAALADLCVLVAFAACVLYWVL